MASVLDDLQKDTIFNDDTAADTADGNYFNAFQLQKRVTARTETWLWLANALGYDCAQSQGVLREYTDIEKLVNDRFKCDLSHLLTNGQIEYLRAKEPEDFACRIHECERKEVGIVTFDSEDYPALLREIDTPPPVLYYRGDIKILNKHLTIAMVGTRRPSAYGVEATRKIGEELAKANITLVSGLASGLDSECHKASLQNEAKTVACIAFGHDKCYPAANAHLKQLIEKHGVVISEYPPDTLQQKAFFLQRNRLIAGLSSGLCVAEARAKSGTMNTVSCALKYGRDVFSIPGSIFSPLCEGTNNLIKEGAMPVTSAQDILQWYNLEMSEKGEAFLEDESNVLTLSPQSRQVYEALTCKPQTITALCEATNLPISNVIVALTELEIAGVVSQMAGRQFMLNV